MPGNPQVQGTEQQPGVGHRRLFTVAGVDFRYTACAWPSHGPTADDILDNDGSTVYNIHRQGYTGRLRVQMPACGVTGIALSTGSKRGRPFGLCP